MKTMLFEKMANNNLPQFVCMNFALLSEDLSKFAYLFTTKKIDRSWKDIILSVLWFHNESLYECQPIKDWRSAV